MSADPLVRPVEPRDFGAVADITNHYIQTTAIHFSRDPIPADQQQALWEKGRERYPFLVADVGGQVVGYSKAGLWRERDAYAWTPECGIYVRHDLRARGLGRMLYARLFEIMAAQGFHSVIAGATLPNDASVRLHESMGFVPAGVIRRAGWKFDRWWDVAFFQKLLAGPTTPAAPLRSVSEAMKSLRDRRVLPGL